MKLGTFPELVVVGSINVDLMAVAGRLPKPGETVGNAVLVRAPCGKGANQAAAASRLGAVVRMVGAVGSDADGDFAVRALDEAGVDTASVVRTSVPTGTALIVVDGKAENQIVVCPGANAAVSISDLRLDPADTVLVQFELQLDLVLELASRTPGFLAVNASPACHLPTELIARADLVVVNETEYELMPELDQGKLLAVTYGAVGAAMFEYGRRIAFAEGEPTSPINTVGAGDAFCAALVLALRAGLPPAIALKAACRVGAAAVVNPSSQPALEHLANYVGGRWPAPRLARVRVRPGRDSSMES